MNEMLKRLLARGGYMDKAGDGTGDAGDGGGSGGAGDGDADDKGGAGDGGDKGGAGEGGKKTGPTDEEARLLKENMKKKEELKKAQEDLANLRKQFEGIDPEAVRKLLDDQKVAETKSLEAKGDYERLKTRMAEEHAKEVKTLKDQITALQGDLGKASGTINELTVGTQFSQSKFIGDELTLTPAKARLIYGDYFDVQEGKVVGYDKPRGSANRTALVDQYGSPVAFDEAMRKIVDTDPEKDHLIKSKTKPGAGSDSRKPSGDAGKEPAQTDSVSKIAAGLKGIKLT